MSQLATITATLNSELEGLEHRLEELQPAFRVTELLADYEAIWEHLDTMTLEAQRQLITEMVTKLVILPRGRGKRSFTWDSVQLELRG